jgi:C4-dicarboxylate-specific signal transduction histidine kinase
MLVRDSGVGLDPRLDPRGAEKLFEAFHTTKAHGLGIGMAEQICTTAHDLVDPDLRIGW